MNFVFSLLAGDGTLGQVEISEAFTEDIQFSEDFTRFINSIYYYLV